MTPTYLIINADGDEAMILAASGLYPFGFTYLYVGWNLLGNLDGTGLGMFWLFVLLLGRKQEGLGKYTGVVAAVQGWVTGAIPAFLLLTGRLDFIAADPFAILLAAFGVVIFGALFVGMRQRATASTSWPATEPRPAERQVTASTSFARD